MVFGVFGFLCFGWSIFLGGEYIYISLDLETSIHFWLFAVLYRFLPKRT